MRKRKRGPWSGRAWKRLALATVATGICLAQLSCAAKTSPSKGLQKISLGEGASVDEYREWARQQIEGAQEEEKAAATLMAVSLLREACAKEEARACVALGQVIQETSQDHSISPVASERALTRACSLEPGLCVYLAQAHCEGGAVASNLAQAEELYQRACAGNSTSPKACQEFESSCRERLKKGNEPTIPPGILGCAQGESCSTYSTALKSASERAETPEERLALNEKSEAVLERGCKKLVAGDCLLLGSHLLLAVNTREDGIKYLEEACSIQADQCHPAAQLLNESAPGSAPVIFSLLEPVCREMGVGACQTMARLCSVGFQSACRHMKHVEYEQFGVVPMGRDCRLGDDVACGHFWLLAPLRGLDDGEQISVLRDGCDAGSEKACVRLPGLISQTKAKFPVDWRPKAQPTADTTKRKRLREGCLQSCSGCQKLVEEVKTVEESADLEAFARAIECTCQDLSSPRSIRICAGAAEVNPDRADRGLLETLCQKSEKDCNLLAADLYGEVPEVARFDLFLRACMAGNGDSCSSVLGSLSHSIAGEISLSDRQIDSLKLLCDKDARNCLPYAIQLTRGSSESRRYIRLVSALKLLEDACKRDRRSCGLSVALAELINLGPGLATPYLARTAVYARACRAHGRGTYACSALAKQGTDSIDSALCGLGEVKRCK